MKLFIRNKTRVDASFFGNSRHASSSEASSSDASPASAALVTRTPCPSGYAWVGHDYTMPDVGPRLNHPGVVTQPGGEAALAMPVGGSKFVRDAMFSAVAEGDVAALSHCYAVHPASLTAQCHNATLVQKAAELNQGEILAWLLQRAPQRFAEAFVAQARQANSVVAPVLINVASQYKKHRKPMLVMAARHGVVQLVRGLVAGLKCNPDFCINNMTPLRAAVRAGHTEVVHELLRHIHCVNHAVVTGINTAHQPYPVFPLVDAVAQNRPEMVRLLVTHGAQARGFAHEQHVGSELRSHTLLALAARSGNPDMVTALLEAGADVHAGGSVARGGIVTKRVSPLVDAMAHSHYAAASALLVGVANLLDLLSVQPSPPWASAHAQLESAYLALERSHQSFLPATLSRRVRDERAVAQTRFNQAYRGLVDTIRRLAATQGVATPASRQA